MVLLLSLAAALHAAPPLTPGPALGTEHDPYWTSLFESLGQPRTIESTFDEARWFGFRKTPILLRGEMRLDPERGLSLEYRTPEERVIIMDDKGLVLRDARGNTRIPPTDARAVGIEQALLPALRFNLPEIRKGFVIHAANRGADWRLDLEPKDARVARSLGTLVIEGNGQRVQQIEFGRSATQRVVITIVTTQEGVRFSRDDLRRFFR